MKEDNNNRNDEENDENEEGVQNMHVLQIQTDTLFVRRSGSNEFKMKKDRRRRKKQFFFVQKTSKIYTQKTKNNTQIYTFIYES